MKNIFDNIILLIIIISVISSAVKKLREFFGKPDSNAQETYAEASEEEYVFKPEPHKAPVAMQAAPAKTKIHKPIKPAPAKHTAVSNPDSEPETVVQQEEYIPFSIDFSDDDELKKAVIYSEIMNRKEF
jgi:hypothetical protein